MVEDGLPHINRITTTGMKETHLKVFTTFSGYDSQCVALDKIAEEHPEFSYELTGWSEIDKYAIKAHNLLFPQYENLNLGDITKIDWDKAPGFDLLTYSSPCTNFSSLGNRKGGEKNSGTASSLLWSVLDAIETKRPTYLLMENVADISKQKFIKTLHNWISSLENLGYSNHAFITDASHFGLPQKRRRLIMVSKLGQLDFIPPTGNDRNTHIKDFLDTNPENYQKTPNKTLRQYSHINPKHPVIIPRTHGYIKPIPRTQIPVLTTSCGSDYFILFPDRSSRGISPSEALRLMGLSQQQINILTESDIPATQLFKLAGNSIAVPVITQTLSNLILNTKPSSEFQTSLF